MHGLGPTHTPPTLPDTLSPSAHPVSCATAITVLVPGPLRASAGASELTVSATSLRALLEELERNHPALHRSICDETGTVRRHVNLFVNINHMRDRNGLDTPLASGDVVTILPAVSGG
jgi:sulfur-carrier protein